MRAKVCEDGRARILAKVVVPMGVDELVKYAMSNPMFRNDRDELDEDAMNAFENLNKRTLFNVAKDTVALGGVQPEIADQVVSQLWSEKQIARARAHVVRIFPEVD